MRFAAHEALRKLLVVQNGAYCVYISHRLLVGGPKVWTTLKIRNQIRPNLLHNKITALSFSTQVSFLNRS